MAVSSIIHSKTFDNGMICASEQSVTVMDSDLGGRGNRYAGHLGNFGGGLAHDLGVQRAVDEDNAADLIQLIALEEIAAPNGELLLHLIIDGIHNGDRLLAHEKLSPVLAMYRAKTFDQAVANAEQLVADGGIGHTASLYINPSRTDRYDQFVKAMKACRVVVNTPSSHGGIGDLYNFKLRPSLTLGCGSWGNNSVSENVGPMHLINIKSVAERRENMLWFRTPQKVYFKKGSMPVALNELRDVMGKKKALQLVVRQGILHPGFLVGDDGEGRHLAAGAGGGGDRDKVGLLPHLGEGVDTLADVHRIPAPGL